LRAQAKQSIAPRKESSVKNSEVIDASL